MLYYAYAKLDVLGTVYMYVWGTLPGPKRKNKKKGK